MVGTEPSSRKITATDRLLLLAAGLLAAYQVVVGVEGLATLAVTSYTIGFGVLLVAGLLLIILGFEVLESPLVVIASTIIPLSLSSGLVAEHLPRLTTFYLGFSILGFLAVAATRLAASRRLALVILACVHGVSGLLIFGLPLVMSLNGSRPAGFALVSLGGALIGVGGLLLSFLRAGRPILSRQTIMAIFPVLLLLTTAAFVAGFALG